jgi:hypothetical protein
MTLAGTGVFAAEAEHPGAVPPAVGANPSASTPTVPMTGMSSGDLGNIPMISRMRVIIGEKIMVAHIERRIAFLRAKLKITEAQQPLWDAVAEAMRSNAKDMVEILPAVTGASGTLPERLAAREKATSANLSAIRRLRSAFDPLYGAFSQDQQKVADGLMIEPRSVLGVGTM